MENNTHGVSIARQNLANTMAQVNPIVAPSSCYRSLTGRKNNHVAQSWLQDTGFGLSSRDPLKNPVPALDLRVFLDHEAALQA